MIMFIFEIKNTKLQGVYSSVLLCMLCSVAVSTMGRARGVKYYVCGLIRVRVAQNFSGIIP